MSSSGIRNLRQSPEEYAKRLWDWTRLNDAFDRGIRATDIDGMVESSRRFLFLEGKSGHSRPKKGQLMALTRLAEIPNITVLILEGHAPDTITGWSALGGQRYTGDYDALVAFVRIWFESGSVP